MWTTPDRQWTLSDLFFIFFPHLLFPFYFHFWGLKISKSFLSLEPPSYIVASVRDIRNIITSSSTNTTPTQNSILPTVYQVNNTGMDILKGWASDNCNKMRERMFSQSSNVSRDTSMSSTKSSVVYHKRMEKNNDMDINKDVSPGLSYETSQEQTIHLSTTA